MRLNSKYSWLLVAVAMCFLGGWGSCGERLDDFGDGGVGPDSANPDATPDPDGGDPDGGDAGPTGPMLRIYAEGDLTAKTFTDGLSGQTPDPYIMRLQRFDVMRSATDASPVTVFDHGENPVEADMLSRTLTGQAPIASLTPGTYTHGRALLTSTTFTVNATVHYLGNHVPGQVEIFAALSDTTYQGTEYSQGDATYTFSLYPDPSPAVLPEYPSTAGGTVVQEGGRTWLVFPFSEPCTLSDQPEQDIEATIYYDVFESFRWEDQPLTDYQTGVFDVTPTSYEPVWNVGATGYRIEWQ